MICGLEEKVYLEGDSYIADAIRQYKIKIEYIELTVEQQALLERIHAQSDFDYGFEQTRLSADFMERVDMKESLIIVLCFLGELISLIALISFIHFSFEAIFS